jgi:hypothetical protein
MPLRGWVRLLVIDGDPTSPVSLLSFSLSMVIQHRHCVVLWITSRYLRRRIQMPFNWGIVGHRGGIELAWWMRAFDGCSQRGLNCSFHRGRSPRESSGTLTVMTLRLTVHEQRDWAPLGDER